MAGVPFPLEHELNMELRFDCAESSLLSSDQEDQSNISLPGQPRIPLNCSKRLDQYLFEEHLTTNLDDMASKLWLVGLVYHCLDTGLR